MKLVPKPDRSTPLLAPDGKSISEAWDEYFQYLSSLNLPALSRTAPTNGQTLLYNAVTQVWGPGAN